MMLQDNVANPGRRAHVAHASLVGLHALCCGAPLLAVTVASLSGAAASVLLPAPFAALHSLLHAHEIWVLAASAILLALGAGFEIQSRLGGRVRGFPVLFLLSGLCFLANLAIILGHWLGPR